MAYMNKLDRELRTFLQMYKWQRIDPVPWSKPDKPLEKARLGLVVTACMTLPTQPPFEAHRPENDPSVRIFGLDTDPATLVNTYPEQNFDHEGLKRDANLLVPIDRLHEMVADGEIGEMAPQVVSLCGHLPKPKALMEETAPLIAHTFLQDEADIVLLVPA